MAIAIAVTAAVATAAIAAGTAAAAQDKANHANIKAQKAEANYQSRVKGFQDTLQRNTGQFGDIALDTSRQGADALQPAIAGLEQQALNPTETPGFALAAKEGLNALQANFATTGSPQSGAASIAAGRFVSGLSAEALTRQQQSLQQLAQLGAQLALPAHSENIQGNQQQVQLYDVLGRSVGRKSQLQINQGLQKAETINAYGKAGEGLVSGVAGAYGGGSTGAGGGSGGGPVTYVSQ